MNDHEKLILQTYKLEAVKTARYGAGVSAAIARSKFAKNVNPYTEMAPIETDAMLYRSDIGTPVFCNLEIQGGSWTDSNNVLHTWPDLVYDTVLITVNSSKNIVKTAIQGRNGTVKEYISDGDDQINIKLLIVGARGKMPLQEVSDLKKALDAPVSLAINSRYLQNLGINNFVVDSISMPQVEGGYHFQAVEINASSDEPIELKF